jgi:MSHA pilin protein MshD
MKIQKAKIKEVPVISVCVRKKLTLLTDTVTAVFKSRSGFSLIEIIMIIVVVSIAIPALLILVGGEAGRGVEPELRITATNVAQQLLDEIMTKCWDENLISGGICGAATMTTYSDLGIDTGEDTTPPYDTSTYDDIDDYAQGVDAVSVGGISYSRSVVVCYVPYNNLTTSTCNTTTALGTDYKRIAVTVTSGSTSVVLTTVMTNY